MWQSPGKDPFEDIKIIAPPRNLSVRILDYIRRKDLTVSQRVVIVAIVGLAMSVGVLGITAVMFSGAFMQSEMLQFLSLIITDPKVILTGWYDYTFSLLESMPITYITAFLVALFAVFASAGYAVRYNSRASTLRSKLGV